jgi:probable phosphoglycerate mutase
MLKILIFRHALASGNKKHILNGSKIDSRLTRKGRKQAKELVKKIKIKPDIIFSSPLKRAKQTAYYFIKKYKIKPVILDILKEQDFGDWSGLDATKVKKLYPKSFFSYANGEKSNFVINCPNGESYEQIKKRAKKFLDFLKENYKNKTIFVFSHGVFIISIIELITKIKPPQVFNLHLKNAEWIELKF